MICASLHSFKSCSLCIASAQGGDSACGAEGGGLPLRAMLIKSALRDWLSMSYGMKSITSISHLRWPPPLWCLTAPKGGCISSPVRAVVKVLYKLAPKAPYLASAAILYNSRGREPGARPGGVSRSRTEPLAPRAKGPAAPSTLTPVRACQPSGIQPSAAQVPVPAAPQAPTITL